MNSKIKKIFSGLLAVCIMAMMLPGAVMTSFAATNAKISFSDPTVTLGEEVRVTMKFETTNGEILGDTKTMLSYDASALEYISEEENVNGAGSIRVNSGPGAGASVTTILRFKALKTGTSTITVVDWNGYDNNGQVLNVEHEGSSTVTVNPLATSSKDALLKSLQVSPGTLSPSFTPQQDTYQVAVDLDADRLTVSGEANNGSAKLDVQGADALQEGANTVQCIVTAEDGVTTKTYTITVNKVAGGGTAAPDGENSQEVPEDVVLATLDIAAKKISILTPPEGLEIPQGLKNSTIAIGESKVKVPGWIWSEDEAAQARYCVVYGMNESGDKGFYRYDLDEKTVQRYFEDPAISNMVGSDVYLALAENYNSLLQDFKIRLYILIGAAAAAVILLILLIVTVTGKKKNAPAVRTSRREADPEEEELKTYVPVSGGSRKTASREERYMRGEEDEYVEYDEVDSDDDDDSYLSGAEAAAGLDDMEKALETRLAEESSDSEYDSDDDDDFEIFDL